MASTRTSDHDMTSDSVRVDAFGRISTSVFRRIERLTFASPDTELKGASSATRTGTPWILSRRASARPSPPLLPLPQMMPIFMPPRPSKKLSISASIAAAAFSIRTGPGMPNSRIALRSMFFIWSAVTIFIILFHRPKPPSGAKRTPRLLVPLVSSLAVSHQHDLRHRISFIGRVREHHLLSAFEVQKVLHPAGDVHDRPAPFSVEHLDVRPLHARAQSRPDRLEHGFFCGKPAGIVLGRELLPGTVFTFLLREHPFKKSGVVLSRLVYTADLYQVDTDTDDHRHPLENNSKYQITNYK